MHGSKLPVPTAKEVNDAHRLARAAAETAVQHAIRCGKLLTAKRATLDRGEFDKWIESHCEFGRSMAYNYIKASKSSNALDDSGRGAAAAAAFSSLRGLLGQSEAKVEKPPQAQPKPTLKAESPQLSAPVAAPEADEPERPEWEPEEDAALEAAERELNASNDKILRADDTTAAMHDEIKRQAAENAVLKMSRDGFMNGKTEMTRLLKAEQRKVEQLGRRVAELERENAKLVEEVDALRERVAIMDAA